mgnify:CR=1 FL=1
MFPGALGQAVVTRQRIGVGAHVALEVAPLVQVVEEDRLAQLFQLLPAPDRAALAGCFRPERFAAGALIIRQGEAGDRYYILESGRVEVTRAGTDLRRARLRGEFIRQANLKGKDYRVDWVYLKLNDPERETILCKDPFQSHDERVERLIRAYNKVKLRISPVYRLESAKGVYRV